MAATPPPRHIALAPIWRAARCAFDTSTSTTASWNEAATSAVATSGWRRTWFTTAVFTPEKEKSRPSLRMARGKAMAVGSPSIATRSIAGPPG